MQAIPRKAKAKASSYKCCCNAPQMPKISMFPHASDSGTLIENERKVNLRDSLLKLELELQREKEKLCRKASPSERIARKMLGKHRDRRDYYEHECRDSSNGESQAPRTRPRSRSGTFYEEKRSESEFRNRQPERLMLYQFDEDYLNDCDDHNHYDEVFAVDTNYEHLNNGKSADIRVAVDVDVDEEAIYEEIGTFKSGDKWAKPSCSSQTSCQGRSQLWNDQCTCMYCEEYEPKEAKEPKKGDDQVNFYYCSNVLENVNVAHDWTQTASPSKSRQKTKPADAADELLTELFDQFMDSDSTGRDRLRLEQNLRLLDQLEERECALQAALRAKKEPSRMRDKTGMLTKRRDEFSCGS